MAPVPMVGSLVNSAVGAGAGRNGGKTCAASSCARATRSGPSTIKRCKQHREFEVIDGGIARGRVLQRLAEPACRGGMRDEADHAMRRRERWGRSCTGGLHGAPGAQHQAVHAVTFEAHRGAQRADGEEAAAKTDQRRAGAKQSSAHRPARQRSRLKTPRAEQHADRRHTLRVATARQLRAGQRRSASSAPPAISAVSCVVAPTPASGSRRRRARG